MESKKVIHVHLINQTFRERSDFYFGSVAAIYEVLNHYVLGVRYRTLAQSLHDNGEFENARCRVTSGEMIRKPRNTEPDI